MKKWLVAAMVAAMGGTAMAATGWYNDYLQISQNGGGDYGYSLTYPTGGEWDGADLGEVYSLTLSSMTLWYWSDAQDRDGGALYYQIFDGVSPTPIVGPTEIIWTQSYEGGVNYYGSYTTPINLLSGATLADEQTYYLQFWAKSWGTTEGDSFLNNGGDPQNYEASFSYESTPIPEPATLGLLGLGALALALRRRLGR